MPVQDEEIKAPVEEADKAHKSETILPLIGAICDNYADKIEDLAENKAEIEDRISHSNDKISALAENADTLEATNEMLTRLMNEHKLPKAASAIIAVNQAKINRIKENQIPKLENSIEKNNKKIDKLDKRIENNSLKADRWKHFSGVIKSFAILNPAKRREQFTLHMDGMRSCSNKLIQNKLEVEQIKLNALYTRYEKTDSAVEKYKLGEKIANQKQVVSTLESKIKYNSKEFSTTDSQLVDKIIAETEKNVENLVDTELSEPSFDLEAVPDTVVVDSTEYLRNAEMAMEDDYDMIDGIINNGKKEEPKEVKETTDEQSKDDIQIDLDSMMALFTLKIFDEVRSFKCDSLTANEMLHIVANSENPIAEMMKHGQKIDMAEYMEIQQSDRFKFSVDFDLNTKTAQLFAINDGRGGVAEPDRNDSNIISKSLKLENFKDSVQKTAPKEQSRSKLIHPEVYKSIPKDERAINNFPKKVAIRIMEELENKNIPYSAFEKGHDVTAITVSKEHESAFKQIEDTAKDEHLKYVHPEVFHEIPKEERFIHQMPEQEVKEAIPKLEKENIPFSAVVNGEKSAITVHKRNAPVIATLTRKQMHEQADALKHGKKNESKQKNQNIEH